MQATTAVGPVFEVSCISLCSNRHIKPNNIRERNLQKITVEKRGKRNSVKENKDKIHIFVAINQFQ